jgi:micrococcal nuclease
MNVSQRRIVMLGIALLVVFSGCAEVNDSIAPTESPASSVNGSLTETASTPEFNLSAASGTRVTVVEVIDGDTINIQYENGTVETVRLLGVDTPETAVTQTTPDEWQSVPTSADGRDWLASWGTQASAYTTDRLANEEIIIIFDPVSDRRGYYDRLLAYVYYSPSATTSFNMRLLENGYARHYESEFSRTKEYKKTAQQARDTATGVWGDNVSSPEQTSAVSHPIDILTVHEDASGNEYDNLDDEYVLFKNTGTSRIQLNGWTISDKAGNLYSFPAGVIINPGESMTLYTGSGSNSDTELYWGKREPVWDNDGDTVIITNHDGETVTTYNY